MNVLVTGGTGYIGEHFIPRLLENGCYIRLLVRNLEKAKKLFGEKCEYVKGDVTSRESLCGCCENIDIVFHMVAKTGNQLPSEKNFADFRKVNVEGTENIINECKRAGIKRFVYVSSTAAMGIVKEKVISEKSQCSPYLPYQITKYEAEQLVLREYRNHGFPGIIIRPTKVYGVGEHEYSYLTLARICDKKIFLKIGKGMNYTSNIYITDFVDGLLNLISRGREGEIYILTSDGSISFEDTGKIIARTIGKSIKMFSVPEKLMIWAAAVEEYIFYMFHKKPIVTKKNIEATATNRIYDISKAKKELDFSPQVSLEDGIERTVQWYMREGLI